jgi:hypothetical protein
MTYPEQTPEQLKEVKETTEEAVLRSYENAKDPWKEYALHCVSIIAKKMEEFTVNDVRPLVNASPYTTQDNRALGAVIKEAARRGWITNTHQTQVNKIGHGVQMSIWRSNIVGEEIDFVSPTVKPEPTPFIENCEHGLPTFVACPNCEQL